MEDARGCDARRLQYACMLDRLKFGDAFVARADAGGPWQEGVVVAVESRAAGDTSTAPPRRIVWGWLRTPPAAGGAAAAAGERVLLNATTWHDFDVVSKVKPRSWCDGAVARVFARSGKSVLGLVEPAVFEGVHPGAVGAPMDASCGPCTNGNGGSSGPYGRLGSSEDIQGYDPALEILPARAVAAVRTVFAGLRQRPPAADDPEVEHAEEDAIGDPSRNGVDCRGQLVGLARDRRAHVFTSDFLLRDATMAVAGVVIPRCLADTATPLDDASNVGGGVVPGPGAGADGSTSVSASPAPKDVHQHQHPHPRHHRQHHAHASPRRRENSTASAASAAQDAAFAPRRVLFKDVQCPLRGVAHRRRHAACRNHAMGQLVERFIPECMDVVACVLEDFDAPRAARGAAYAAAATIAVASWWLATRWDGGNPVRERGLLRQVGRCVDAERWCRIRRAFGDAWRERLLEARSQRRARSGCLFFTVCNSAQDALACGTCEKTRLKNYPANGKGRHLCGHGGQRDTARRVGQAPESLVVCPVTPAEENEIAGNGTMSPAFLLGLLLELCTRYDIAVDSHVSVYRRARAHTLRLHLPYKAYAAAAGGGGENPQPLGEGTKKRRVTKKSVSAMNRVLDTPSDTSMLLTVHTRLPLTPLVDDESDSSSGYRSDTELPSAREFDADFETRLNRGDDDDEGDVGEADAAASPKRGMGLENLGTDDSGAGAATDVQRMYLANVAAASPSTAPCGASPSHWHEAGTRGARHVVGLTVLRALKVLRTHCGVDVALPVRR